MSITRTALALIFGALLAASGCKTMDAASGITSSLGLPGQQYMESAARVGAAVSKASEDLTPEQEYYLGRAVAASVLGKYRPYSDPAATRYVNLVGQSLAEASDRPATYGGYRFMVLDSNEINAFAAPGGLILVTRGMLRLCDGEDAVAAVLAHEISHVTLGHGLKTVQRGRLAEACAIMASEGARTFGGDDAAKLTEIFEGSVSDITKTLMVSGYSRAAEEEADAAAAVLLSRVGYDPAALADMLTEMERRLPASGGGFATTHPAASVRLTALADEGVRPQPVNAPKVRQERFALAIGPL